LPVISNIRVEPVAEGAPVYSLLADEPTGYPELNVAAMGEGASQVLPIIARSLWRDEESCLLVEQPELHLHPAAQCSLADLFIDTMKGGTRQVIVETHSEHLLLRLRTRVAEGAVDPAHIAVLYVERQGRESTVRRLALNGHGHFDEWPSGFFEEGYKEAMALAMASQKRKHGKTQPD
jgi:predicted ATPase